VVLAARRESSNETHTELNTLIDPWTHGPTAVMGRTLEPREAVVEITASIGGTVAPTHGSDAHILLQRADIAMCDAKKRWPVGNTIDWGCSGWIGSSICVKFPDSFLDRRLRTRLLVTGAPAKAAPRNQDRRVVHLGNSRPGERLHLRPVERIRAQIGTGPALDREGLLAWNNVD
jgi:GGDEF domain-containing protein